MNLTGPLKSQVFSAFEPVEQIAKARQNGENVNLVGVMAFVAGDRSGPWTGRIGLAPV